MTTHGNMPAAAGAVHPAGKSIIATEEARTNTTYGLLTTPDRVSGVVMPTDGLLFVAYKAEWKESVSGAARAAIFLGGNQLRTSNGPEPTPQETTLGTVNTYLLLATVSAGLKCQVNTGSYVGPDVTTGQVIGVGINAADSGLCGPIFAAAGTFDVSVQFKALSGSVTVKNRKLWVWTADFS